MQQFYKVIFSLTVLFKSLCVFGSSSYDPLIVVVLMVKNEEAVIAQTLQPYIDAGINSYLIFDTGSEDNTISVVQKLFDDYGITDGYIEQEPFVDFATSRNQALRLAENVFPNAAFMLMPDAEWYMQNVETLLTFCAEHVDRYEGSYSVRIGNAGADFTTPRLIRCRRNVRFVGVVHEVLNQASPVTVPADCYFYWSPSAAGQEKSKKRWERDCDLLLKECERNPRDARSLFYLAQTYQCLGDLKEAARWYFARMQVPSFAEENFMAVYRLAQVVEELAKQGPEFTWDDAMHYYLQAFSMRPHRAEPLVKIAQHYWSVDERALCYVFARRAAELPYPQDDMLFIEKEVYDYVRYDILGFSSWYVQEHEVGQNAVLRALEVHPTFAHLHRNLELHSNALTCSC